MRTIFFLLFMAFCFVCVLPVGAGEETPAVASPETEIFIEEPAVLGSLPVAVKDRGAEPDLEVFGGPQALTEAEAGRLVGYEGDAFFMFEETGLEAETMREAPDFYLTDEPFIYAIQEDEEEPFEEEPLEGISDPLEPLNRAFFKFNDKLYFWVMKPIAKGYTKITPKPVRKGLRNFFENLAFPIRFVNCLLQAKGEGAGMEFGRFLVNSTIGLGGFLDVATEGCHYKKYDEDLGQTLQRWGLDPGFYIHWPILGPSSFTDSLGAVGDSFLDPLKYAKIKSKYRTGLRALKQVNGASFLIGEYEALTEAAIDPYLALRDAYYQNRKKKIQE